MRLLLINPPYTNFEGMKESGGHMLPLGLAYIASYLREKLSIDIKILDTEVLGLSYEQIEAEIIKIAPDICGITSPTPTINHVGKISRLIKKISPDCLVAIGGVHPTVAPEESLMITKADFAIIGEGEVTFYELIESIKAGAKDFSSIKGLAWYNNEKIVLNECRDLIQDLNGIPFPARDLFDMKNYYSAPTKIVSADQATPILTSRGCPFNCIHCSSRAIWKGKLRFRSPENVINEIEQCLNNFNLKEFNFFDDTFTANKKRAIEICRLINSRGLKISWICFSRVNTIDDELIKHMKIAGCKKISFGLESGSQELLNIMRKNATLEMGMRAVEMVNKAGLKVHASFMLGNVGETEATIKETIKFSKSLNLDNATFFITSPFPGTDLYDIAKKLGSITDETAKENFAPLTNANPILVQKNLSAQSLIYWQKQAFKEFYIRPRYIIKKIGLLFAPGGLKTLFEGLRVLFRILKKT